MLEPSNPSSLSRRRLAHRQPTPPPSLRRSRREPPRLHNSSIRPAPEGLEAPPLHLPGSRTRVAARSDLTRQVTSLGEHRQKGHIRLTAPARRLEQAVPGTGLSRPLRQSAAPTTQPHQQTRQQRRSRRPPSPVLYVIRLLILGVGVGAIAGTLLSVLNPAMRDPAGAAPATPIAFNPQQSSLASQSLSRDATPGNLTSSSTALRLGEQMAPLAATIQALTAQNPGLTPGVFLVDLDTGAYLDLNGTSTFSAASMIKVPILIAFLQDVDAGEIRLDESLTLQARDIASGSGELQYQPPGTRFNALEIATKMITISDNTATNMLIARMGGAEALNRRFQAWGLTTTAIRSPLPDLEGKNITSPKELVELLAMVSQGDLLSLRSRDRMLDIMQHTVTNTLLPSSLDEGATIAHKTGDIGSLVGDVGVIDMPNGKRYITTIMVQRSHNDDRAQDLIRQISRAAYEYLSQPAGTTSAAVAPDRQ